MSIYDGTKSDDFLLYILLEFYNFLHFRATMSNSNKSISSVAQSCPTLCNLMNRNTPGLPVHHQLLEFAQTHLRREEEMATHSSILAWEITKTQDPGRLFSPWGHKELDMT